MGKPARLASDSNDSARLGSVQLAAGRGWSLKARRGRRQKMQGAERVKAKAGGWGAE